MRASTRLAAVLIGLMAMATGGSAARAADVKATLALPAQSIIFSSIYVAVDRGYFKDEGLDLTTTVVAGPGTLSAVLSGSAEFGTIGGSIVLAAAAKNQRVLIIGNTQDAFTAEMVLRKAKVDTLGVAATADDATRVAKLKGLTIGVDAVGGLPHAYLRYVAKRFGVNADTELTVTPLQPPAMVAALQQGRIDGLVFSAPFTLQAVRDGGVLWFSGARGDLPETVPHAYNALIVRPDYCKANADTCRKFMNAINKALALIKKSPEESLASVQKAFSKMDPDLLKQSFAIAAKVAQPKATVTDKMINNTIAFVRDSGIVPASATLPEASELYNNDFNR